MKKLTFKIHCIPVITLDKPFHKFHRLKRMQLCTVKIRARNISQFERLIPFHLHIFVVNQLD